MTHNRKPFQIMTVIVLICGLFASTVRSQEAIELIESKCFDCHNSSSAEGELDLESLLQVTPLVKELKQWKNIAQRIKLGDMPPADHGTLSSSEKQLFADWFGQSIEGFDYESVAHPGFESIRRLSHDEYRHTVRDLFGADLANTERFPKDLTGNSGFENSSNTLFLQGSLFEKYAQSAEEIVSMAFNSELDVHQRVKQRILDFGGSDQDPRSRSNKIIFKFAARAFRRPTTKKERLNLESIFDSSYEATGEFEASIQKTLTAILVMPQFLMKAESKAVSPDGKIDQFDLATRLSYFLWASMPDDELLSAAMKGKLSDETEIESQIDRMLKNRRAKSLGYVFAAQWLGFDDVGTRRRQDPIDNPWCTESLMKSMKAETSLFFYSLIRDDRTLHELINSRYTYLNEELAKHYHIRGIEGRHMRPVKLKTSIRGGILTHASVLSVTAFPDRTSPVSRGKWVLETLLGTPPPEPPPNVSEFSEEILELDRLSFRQKVQQHSKDPRCFSCHSEMDPIGFAMENFDNFGRWRERAHGRRIDARGKLPDGTKFNGPTELQQVIVEQRIEDLTRQLAQKMLTYALGRQLEYYDEAAVRKIVTETKQGGYRFQTLIKAVARSYPFQHKKILAEEIQ